MFSSKVGVKRGCILRPTLFSIYLNDMVKIFEHISHLYTYFS
jgi:hypothetical protein